MNSHRLSQRVVDLGMALRLGPAARFMLQYAPKSVQARAESWRYRILKSHLGDPLQTDPKMVPKDHKLVPEEALEGRYREALLVLIEKSGSEPLGDYLEFGVYEGTSLACMYRTLKGLNLAHVRLFGFDSFEGLPDTARIDDGGLWRSGQFRCDVKRTRQFLTQQEVDWHRVILVKGWFRDTLNDELTRKYRITKASVIMVDCDMYLSAREALNFSGPLIQDSAVIFFDDWHSGRLDEKNMGEKRAFDEFLHANPQFVAERVSSYHPNAEVFLVKRLHGALESQA
jgi:O-methyltransferase